MSSGSRGPRLFAGADECGSSPRTPAMAAVIATMPAATATSFFPRVSKRPRNERRGAGAPEPASLSLTLIPHTTATRSGYTGRGQGYAGPLCNLSSRAANWADSGPPGEGRVEHPGGVEPALDRQPVLPARV